LCALVSLENVSDGAVGSEGVNRDCSMAKDIEATKKELHPLNILSL